MIVNTSRGGLIDTAALIQGLKATWQGRAVSLFAQTPLARQLWKKHRGWHHRGSCNGRRRRRGSLLLQAETVKCFRLFRRWWFDRQTVWEWTLRFRSVDRPNAVALR